MKKKNLLLIAIAIFGLATLTNAQVPSYVPTNGLVGWWPFNGNANDASGNNNNGIVNGAMLTSDRFGVSNSAYNFNASQNNSIIIGSTPSFNTFEFSISAHIKIPQNGSGYESIFSYLTGSTSLSGYWLGALNSGANVFIANNNSGVDIYGSSLISISDNNWHHVACTFDGTVLKLYIDELLHATQNVNLGLSATNVYIGNNHLNEAFNGIIDDVGFWDRALTSQEVIALNYYPPSPPQSICVVDTFSYDGQKWSNYLNQFQQGVYWPGFNGKMGQVFDDNNNLGINWSSGVTINAISFLVEQIEQVGLSNNITIEIKKLNGGNYCNTSNCSWNYLDSIPGTTLHTQTVQTSSIIYNSINSTATINLSNPVTVDPNTDFAVIFDFSQIGNDTLHPMFIANSVNPPSSIAELPNTNCWRTVDDVFCNLMQDQINEVAMGLHIQNQPINLNHTICSGDTVILEFNWSGNSTNLPSPIGVYSWNPAPLLSNGSTAYYVPSGNLNVSCTFNSSCGEQVINNHTIVVQNSPVVDAGANTSICQGTNIVFNPVISGNFNQINWSGPSLQNSTLINASASPMSSTWYYLNVSNNILGCSSLDSIFVNVVSPIYQPVCIVSTDSVTGDYNVIVWEKPTQLGYIDSFYVYREVTLNNYQKIGAVHYDSLSIFNDLNANPNVTSYRYKVTSIDTCGNESQLSDYHSTIHLQYLGSGNFQWSSYLIENLSNQVSSYNFYRDDNGTGQFQLIQVIPSSNNTFTDIDFALFPNAQYRVDVNWLNGVSCSPSRSVSSSYSNIYSLNSSLFTNEYFENFLFTVFPNPAQSVINIKADSKLIGSVYSIYDNTGRVVLSGKINSVNTTIELGNLSGGIYMFSIGDNMKQTFKVIKE